MLVSRAERKTVGEAGVVYLEHLETIKQRKPTTMADYRGYLRRHLEPYFATRTLDRIEPELVEAYMRLKLETLSSKMVVNHLNFLHGLFGLELEIGQRAATTRGRKLPVRTSAARRVVNAARTGCAARLAFTCVASPPTPSSKVERSPPFACCPVTAHW